MKKIITLTIILLITSFYFVGCKTYLVGVDCVTCADIINGDIDTKSEIGICPESQAALDNLLNFACVNGKCDCFETLEDRFCFECGLKKGAKECLIKNHNNEYADCIEDYEL